VFRSAMLLAAECAVVLAFVGASKAAAQPSCPRVDLTLVEPRASSETRPVTLGDLTIYVRRSAIATTSDISEIELVRDEAREDGDVFVLITHIPAAAARLLDTTTDRDGQNMALVVDDDAWVLFTKEAPGVIGPNSSQFRFSSGLLARAQRLAESIQGCAADKRAN